MSEIQNKILKFDLSPKNLKVKNLLNQDFLVVEMRAISTARPNRNNSHFTKEAMENALPSFYNKPVLGSFSVRDNDFGGHDCELDYDPELEQAYFDYTAPGSETPLGLIRAEDKVYITYDEKEGLHWINFTCALWVKYGYKQIKKLLRSKTGRKKISVEVEVNDYYYDENGVEIITDFTFDGVTILSDDLETGIADAEMTILDMVENTIFQKKQKCLAYAYDSLKNNSESIVATFTDDIRPDFEDSVDNEKVDNITMNKETQEGGDSVLTYENKRNLLEAELNKFFKHSDVSNDTCCYVWVCDLTDSIVFFGLGDEYYSASYSIFMEGEEHTVSIDLENKIRVIRSWTNFSENESGKGGKEETMEIEKKETMSNDVVENPEGDGIVFSDNDPDVESGKKDDDTHDVDMSNNESGKEEFEDCNSNSENFEEDDSNEDISNEDDDDDDDDDSHNGHDDDKESYSANEVLTKEDTVKETETKESKFIQIGEEKLDLEGLYARFTALSASYTEVSSNLTIMTEKFEALNNEIETQKIKEFESFGHSMIDAETDIQDVDRKIGMKAQISEKCSNKEFTSIEDVKRFTVNMLAMACYEQKMTQKTSKANEKQHEEFNVSITKPIQINVPKTDVEVLKDSMNKLNRI